MSVLEATMEPVHRESVRRLTKDVKEAARKLSDREARYLCDTYLQMQKSRVRAGNQVKALAKQGEPNSALQWFGEESAMLESRVKTLLLSYAEAQPAAAWALKQVGVGPVIAAGLAAHIQLERWVKQGEEYVRVRQTSCGDVWRHAGLDPTVKWNKHEKRPWNTRLKTILFFAGDCFIKCQNHPDCYYGHHYTERRAYEDARNIAGELRSEADRALSEKNYGTDTEARKWYEQGMLPPAHMLARARRWTVKLFVSHYWQIAYRYKWGTKPPAPWVITHGQHAHRLSIPDDPWNGDW